MGNKQIQFSFASDNETTDPDFQKQTKVELTNENAQKIIEKWVKDNKVVLFMKGTPLNPQCGYSNFVVELLKKYGNSSFNSRPQRIQVSQRFVKPHHPGASETLQ